MNKLDKQYIDLCNKIISEGYESGDRTGTGTKKIFATEIRHKMSEGFPLLTTKKMFTKGVIHELLWFLSGDTNTKYLIDNGVNIWVGDCHKKYEKYWNESNKNSLSEELFNSAPLLNEEEFIEYIKSHDISDPFVSKFADIGPGYGKQWRAFGTGKTGKDQIKDVINKLKENPDNRRIMVSAWDPNSVEQTTLPPCHYGFQLWTRELTLEERWVLGQFKQREKFEKNKDGEFFNFVIYKEIYSDFYNVTPFDDEKIENEIKLLLDQSEIPKHEISLLWNQRSCDFLLGAPFNIASYGFLLEMVAQQVNMVPGELIGRFGDTHLYKNQIEIYKEKQMNNEGFELPRLNLNKAKDIFSYTIEDFKIEGYQSNDSIKYPLSN